VFINAFFDVFPPGRVVVAWDDPNADSKVVEKVGDALRERLSVLSNIEYSAVVLRGFDDYISEATPSMIGLDQLNSSRYPRRFETRVEQKRLEASYLSTIFKMNDDGVSRLFCRNWYDANEGVNKGLAAYGELNSNDGRISNQEDSAESMNVVNCLFGLKSTEFHTALYDCFSDVLQSRDLEVATVENQIELKSVSKKVGSKGGVTIYTKKIVLGAGYVPLSMTSTEERDWVNLSITDAIFMSDMKMLGGVDMPQRAKVLRKVSKNGQSESANVYQIQVTYLGTGHLTTQDLEFQYPNRTVVVDVLSQGAYLVDSNGRKKTLDTPIGFESSHETKSSVGKRSTKWTLIIVNGLTILCILLFVRIRKKFARLES
jgi:hypothetical protein